MVRSLISYLGDFGGSSINEIWCFFETREIPTLVSSNATQRLSVVFSEAVQTSKYLEEKHESAV